MSLPALTIHIGAPKTGSTWIQRFLFDNRVALLRDQGILYPDVNLRGYGHHDLAFLVGGGYPAWAIPQPRSLDELQADLARVVAGHGGDIILSSENFYLYPDPVRLRGILGATGAGSGRTVRILVYIRRQDDAHESWYNQTVKAQGETHTLEQCIERNAGLWDYQAQLARWSAAFGRESLCVRPYDPASYMGGDLRSDFLHHAGIRDSALVAPPEEVNWSLNRDLLAFQRMINCLPLTPVHKRRWHRQLMELSRQSAGSGRFDEAPLLPAPLRAEILRRYQVSNAAVAVEYLGGRGPFAAPASGTDRGELATTGLTLRKVMHIVWWLSRQWI